MAWWNLLSGLLTSGKEVAEVFVENKEKKSEREHQENMADAGLDMASLKQFSSEFHSRQNRTWWDSLVDGLNRLPRPLLTITVLSFFVLAPVDPQRFLQIAKSYQLMPPGYWALLSVIIGFYFGGRMQLKAQDMTVKKDAMSAAKELVAMRRGFRQLNGEDVSTESKIYDTAVINDGVQPKNKVVEEWLKGRDIPTLTAPVETQH